MTQETLTLTAIALLALIVMILILKKQVNPDRKTLTFLAKAVFAATVALIAAYNLF